MLTYGKKIYHQSRVLRREQSIGLFRKALRRLLSERQGGGIDPPPLPERVMENALPGRGLK